MKSPLPLPGNSSPIVWGDRIFKLSLLPTGVLNPNVTSVIANGVVVYPPRFQEEIESLRAVGVNVGANLTISDHAHVIFPYHMEEEALRERFSGQAIGTTQRGITIPISQMQALKHSHLPLRPCIFTGIKNDAQHIRPTAQQRVQQHMLRQPLAPTRRIGSQFSGVAVLPPVSGG